MQTWLPARAPAAARSATPGGGRSFAAMPSMLLLQQQAGNRAVASMVQRLPCCPSCAAGRSCDGSSQTADEEAGAPHVPARPAQRAPEAAPDRPVLREGSTGPAVSELQSGLNEAVAAGLTVDGQFGPATGKAVRAFQASRGLTPDGIAGPQTFGELGQAATAEEAASKPKATDPADDFRIKGLPADSAEHPDSIFFDFGSSTIAESELGKLDALAQEADGLDLEGSSSEEGQGNTALT